MIQVWNASQQTTGPYESSRCVVVLRRSNGLRPVALDKQDEIFHETQVYGVCACALRARAHPAGKIGK